MRDLAKEIVAWKETTRGTIQHDSAEPGDDRPDYLGGGGYLIALDTETDGLAWEDGNRPFLATVSDYDRDWLYYLPCDDAVMSERVDDGATALREAIAKANGIIFHNASFDVHHLVAAGVCEMDDLLGKELHDTDLLARVVLGGNRPAGFTLKGLAEEFVDSSAKGAQDAVKERMVSLGLIQRADQKSSPDGAYKQVWSAYPAILEEYALRDTRYTYDLFNVLVEKATDEDMIVYEAERALLPVIIRMEHRGIALDQRRVNELHAQYSERAARQQDTLYSFNDGVPFNVDAPSEVSPVLMENGVEIKEKTATGQPRIDKWILGKHAENPVVSALLTYRESAKFLSTYLGPMQGREHVHPSYWQRGAWTGRLSCSRPNLQNIPVRSGPEIRSVFVPRPGHSLIVADYSSIELRLLAYYMADDGLWEIIESGDPFLWLGEQVYGTADQSKWAITRQNLKNGFYALTYGAGGPKLAATIGGGMTAEQGRQLAKRIRGALGQNYRTLTRRIEDAIKRRGYVRTLLGARQVVPPERSYVGLNALIQGSASEIMKVALVRADEVVRDTHDGHLLLTVHDEIVAEVPAGRADFALKTLRLAMESCSDLAGDGLRLVASGTVCEHHYGEAK